MTADSPPPNSHRKLVFLLLLGAVSALWAGFLWHELLEARTGGDPFCGFGDDGDCVALWDAGFASAIHRWTGVPVAGWGMVWGLVATLLPAALLARRGDALKMRGAVRLVAFVGVLGVAVLILVSVAEGLFCTSCGVTYVVTAIYAGLALPAWSGASFLRGLGTATLAALGCYLVLLYPGLETPKNTDEEAQRALARITESRARGELSGEPPARRDERAPEAMAETPRAGRGYGAGPVEGGVAAGSQERDFWEREALSIEVIAEATGRDFGLELRQLINELPQALKQGLADSIYFFEHSKVFPPEPPRALLGSATAPVVFTEFTDTLCSHCASLHENMVYVFRNLPEAAWAFEARQFPLDGRCNPKLDPRGDDSVRCLAAKAKICMEDHPYEAFEYAGDLFAEMDTLTPRRVIELAEPYVFKMPLEECLEREETRSKLAADAEYAWRYELQGTPLILINGREAPPFGPFLYAMVLTGGDPRHPIFAEMLPAPSSGIPVSHP